MRVLTCLIYEHDPLIVLLAIIMCLCGSYVSIELLRRTLQVDGAARKYWTVLTAVTAGAAIWSTHFIAMLGYKSGVPVSLNGAMTVFSALIAVVGCSIGIYLAGMRRVVPAAILGGGTIGLAISAMHYVGMFAYRAQGVVNWLPEYVVVSILLSVGLSAAAVAVVHKQVDRDGPRYLAMAAFVGAIATLHFTGMAAFTVTPLAGLESGIDSDAFQGLAAAIALVAMLILGAGIATSLVDSHNRDESRSKLRHIALHDALTDLPNRHQFNSELKAACAALKDEGDGFALVMIDLDGFKLVNDSLGHPAGDKVLGKVATRLRHAVRDGDLVARIGGDEFAVICRDTADRDSVMKLAARIVEVLGRPYVLGPQLADLGASLGVAMAPRDGEEASILNHHADTALYAAKKEGRGCYREFEPRMSDDIRARRLLEADLRRALSRDEFFVEYQPIVKTDGSGYRGAEALVRWKSPTHGLVSPADFIPLAEELGIIDRIGEFVLRQACKEAATWDSDYCVSVNLSPKQLLDRRLVGLVHSVLQDSGLSPQQLDLEITETALIGNAVFVRGLLGELQELGVSISLDDFGTGYSSLSYLHGFPINRIKIDRSFIQQLPSNSDSASIVRAISQLGTSLGLAITAEGIETNDQHMFMREQGCECLQGFLFDRPRTASHISDLFKKRKAA